MELHRLPASIELTLEEARALYLAIGAALVGGHEILPRGGQIAAHWRT